MTSPTPADFVTDHLFVLVGTNTLPNYVAIKLLATERTCVYLVYSMTTKTQKDAIRRALDLDVGESTGSRRYPHLIDVLLPNEADPSSVTAAIHSKLRDIPAGQAVGLHYTGGTKVMAVHSYVAVRDFRDKRFSRIVFSYLDANRLCLSAEDMRRGDGPQPMPVSTAIKVPLEMVLQLHNRQVLKQPIRTAAIWQEVAENLVHFVAGGTKRGAKRWQDWCRRRFEIWDSQIDVSGLAHVLTGLSEGEALEFAQSLLNDDVNLRDWRNWCTRRGFSIRKSSDQDKELALRQALESLPFGHVYDDDPRDLFLRDDVKKHILEPLQRATNLSLGDGTVTFRDLMLASPFSTDDHPYVRLAHWLNGGWLEDYVFSRLELLKQSCALHSLAIGIRPQIGVDGERDFEFDVACMRGYQLFAFSCTTSDEFKTCKQKLLEAVVRARQLGGSEARIALVCCSEKPDTIKYEVDALVSDNQVAVFGRHHLLDLDRQIGTWIDSVSGMPPSDA